MHIVMYAGGIPFNGETIEHESLGGSESAAYYVAKELAARGHEVNLFTENQKGGIFDGVKYVWCGERTPDQPLGRDYHFYVENTPHDVNIAQRHPAAYLKPNRAKVNLWWCHDIALKRNIAPVTGQLWQIDAIMPVSRWFKDQICETWNINPDIVEPIHNGVDYSLFEEFELKDNSVDSEEPVTLIYSSRPERGLERLVKPGGIMERLHEAGVNAELKVCGYIHDVPELSGFYHMLRSQIDLLPNCEHLGSLTKRDLYELMCTKADVWCYPTEFEEVSCITAMESMAAGLTIATTSTAALPETLGDYPNCVQFNNDENVEDKFVDWVTRFNNKFRRQPRRERTWASTTDEIEAIIVDCLSKRKTPEAVARHYLRYSDIVPLEDLITRHPDEVSSQVKEQLSLYAWKDDPVEYGKHYADGTEEMYDSDEFRYEENFDQHPRFQAVLSEITRLLQDKLVNNEDTSLKVLDYGCAHGHFTNYLAKMMPAHEFLGIDVSPKAVRIATDKAVEWDLRNVVYSEGDWLLGDIKNGAFDSYDVLILGEILEHVPDPAEFMEVCRRTVGPETLIIITTPFGPWEHASYEKEFPKRYHLHHFERQDIKEMFAHHPDFDLKCLPVGPNLTGELLGWYIYSFTMNEGPMSCCYDIDYVRKFEETVPKQTVSLCLIAKDAQYELPRFLKSVEPFVDEVIIGIDKTTTDDTRSAVELLVKKINAKQHRAPHLRLHVSDIEPAVETGFAAARNAVIGKASMDWVLWGDCDEEMISGERIWRYLRNNQWRGYGVPQHHFSTEPLGVLSTDYPVRLFRNFEDVRFFGIVHEHPECKDTLNKGVGHAIQIYDVHFSHYGYKTEAVRRARFERNVRLMARDREENPWRILGKFLWVRDLALMCRFDLEKTGGVITPEMRNQALLGLQTWEKALDEHGDHPQAIRMVKDHLEFYNTLTNVVDQGFTFKMKLSSGMDLNAPELAQMPELQARFLNKRHLDKFLSVVINGEVKDYEGKYL